MHIAVEISAVALFVPGAGAPPETSTGFYKSQAGAYYLQPGSTFRYKVPTVVETVGSYASPVDGGYFAADQDSPYISPVP